MPKNQYFSLVSAVLLTTITLASNILSTQVFAAFSAKAKHILTKATGKVELKRRFGSRFYPVYPGTRLNPGDLLKPAPGVKVTVRCSNGKSPSVPAGITTGLNTICPQQPKKILGRPIIAPRPGNPYIPYIISPRATELLTDRPTLRWNRIAGASNFTVTVRGLGLQWTKKVSVNQVCSNSTNTCSFAYPADKPALQPKRSYKLIVEADTLASSQQDDSAGLGFKLISENKAVEVQNMIKNLQVEDLSEEMKAFTLANIYDEYNLKAKAIETLETLAKQKSQITSVYLFLGDLYLKLGLSREAEEPLNKTIELAKAQQDLEKVAAAQLGLGKVYTARAAELENYQKAIDWLEKAKVSYKNLGDTQKIKEVEDLLSELRDLQE